MLFRLWRGREALARESEQAYETYAGGDVLDVGAFHGWYSALLAPKAGGPARFVSCEPDARAAELLRENLAVVSRLFPEAEISLVTEPVGDGRPVSATWPSGEAGHPSFTVVEGATDDGVTIDALVRRKRLQPRFVKIDVEGAEWFALNGMGETLEVHRPTVMLEVHPNWQPEGVTPDRVEAILSDAGYSMRLLDEDEVAQRQLWQPG
jgi:FkbM family methyltransferase